MTKNRRIIVLTGVSRGLGRAMADGFVARGHIVWACARSAGAVAGWSRRWGGASFVHDSGREVERRRAEVGAALPGSWGARSDCQQCGSDQSQRQPLGSVGARVLSSRGRQCQRSVQHHPPLRSRDGEAEAGCGRQFQFYLGTLDIAGRGTLLRGEVGCGGAYALARG